MFGRPHRAQKTKKADEATPYLTPTPVTQLGARQGLREWGPCGREEVILEDRGDGDGSVLFCFLFNMVQEEQHTSFEI